MFHVSYIMQFPKNKHAPEGEPVYQIVEEFAEDHQISAKDLCEAHKQMPSNWYEDLEKSWLGYASLQGGVWTSICFS